MQLGEHGKNQLRCHTVSVLRYHTVIMNMAVMTLERSPFLDVTLVP